MIEINLLPEELRKKKGPLFDLKNLGIKEEKLKFLIGGGFIGILILLLLFLSLGSFIRKKQTFALLAKEKAIETQKMQAEEIDKKTSLLRIKMNALSEITTRKFLWAQKLNEFSDLVLPGIWFTRIRTHAENTIVVEGNVISKKEEAMASLGKFMKNMRENVDFFNDFSNIRLESLQRKSIEERDVVDFEIVLYFKD